MEIATYLLAAASLVLALALLVLGLRLRRLKRALLVTEEWEQLCSQLDVGLGFCDENLNLRRANPAFLGMFINARRRPSPRGGVTLIDQWLGEKGAGHPLQELLVRALSGKKETCGHVRMDDGATCVVRVRRVSLNNGKLLLTIVAGRLVDRAEAGAFTMIAGGADSADERVNDERRGERRRREQLKNENIMRIAHDLRNPLNAAMGWLHLIETDKVPRDELGSAVRRIHNNILRQNGLIDELRKLAEPLSTLKKSQPSARPKLH